MRMNSPYGTCLAGSTAAIRRACRSDRHSWDYPNVPPHFIWGSGGLARRRRLAKGLSS